MPVGQNCLGSAVALPLLVPQRPAQIIVQIGRQLVEPLHKPVVER